MSEEDMEMTLINNRLPYMNLSERIKYLHPFLDEEDEICSECNRKIEDCICSKDEA